MPRKKYEVFVNGDLTYTTDSRARAETMGRFLLEQDSTTSVAIREWVLSSDEVLL